MNVEFFFAMEQVSIPLRNKLLTLCSWGRKDISHVDFPELIFTDNG